MGIARLPFEVRLLSKRFGQNIQAEVNRGPTVHGRRSDSLANETHAPVSDTAVFCHRRWVVFPAHKALPPGEAEVFAEFGKTLKSLDSGGVRRSRRQQVRRHLSPDLGFG